MIYIKIFNYHMIIIIIYKIYLLLNVPKYYFKNIFTKKHMENNILNINYSIYIFVLFFIIFTIIIKIFN